MNKQEKIKSYFFLMALNIVCDGTGLNLNYVTNVIKEVIKNEKSV